MSIVLSLPVHPSIGGCAPCRWAAWVLTLLLVVCQPADAAVPGDPRAGAVAIRHLDVEDGLNHNVVYSMLRDRRGFVWIGTEDGLGRFDGQSIEVIYTDAGRGGSKRDTSALLEDVAGALWIGSWGGGLKRLDPETGRFEVHRHDPGDPTSLSDDRVQTLYLDSGGRLWIGTYKGLDRLVTEVSGGETRARFVHYPRSPGRPPRVWDLTGTPEGELWIGTDDGLELLDPQAIAVADAPAPGEGRIRSFSHDPADPASLAHPQIRALLLDDERRLWIGTERGLDLLLPGERRLRHIPSGPSGSGTLPDDTINVLRQSSEGHVWIGTLDAGLVLLDPSTWNVREHLAFEPMNGNNRGARTSGGLRHIDVRAVFEDPQGLLWVGTRGGGVEIFDRGARAAHRVDLAVGSEGLGNPRESLVTAVLADGLDRPDSVVWVGTDLGLVRVDIEPDGQTTSHRFRHDPDDPTSLVRDNVQVLHRAPNGDLWVGTWRGLDRFEPNSATFVHYPLATDPTFAGDPLTQRIEALADAQTSADTDTALWVGTRAGLAWLDVGTRQTRFWAHEPGNPASLGDDFIQAMVSDPEGILWIGTDAAGLVRFDPVEQTFNHYRHEVGDPHSITSDRIFDIWRDPARGHLWLATDQGLDRFDPRSRRAEHFGIDDGLPNATVKCVIGTADGDALWLSSNGGVSRLSLQAESQAALRGATVRNFGRGDGLAGLLFVSDSCDAGGGSLFFGGTHGLERIDSETEFDTKPDLPLVLTSVTVAGRSVAERSLDLDWDHRSLGFEFAALDYRAPRSVRYAYQLQGFDEDWVETARRYVSYTNVPPGQYVFRVRATDSRGRPTDREIALPIRVTPPLWMRTWFRIGVVLLLATALVTNYKVRTRQLKRQRRILQQKVQEQTQELRRQHRRLEMIDRIVRLINEESDFAEVLHAILEGVSFAQAADRALALIRIREADGQGEEAVRGSFEIGATFGWTDRTPEPAPLERRDIEERYLSAATPLADGIWLGPPSASALLDAEAAAQEAPEQIVAIRILLDGSAAGVPAVQQAQRRRSVLAGGRRGVDESQDACRIRVPKGRHVGPAALAECQEERVPRHRGT